MSGLRAKCIPICNAIAYTSKGTITAISVVLMSMQSAAAISLVNSESISGSSVQADLEQALEQAVSQKDYRLYGINNMYMRVPGIDPGHAAATIQQCGVKRLKDPKQPKESQLEFVTLYNQQMLTLCQQHKRGI